MTAEQKGQNPLGETVPREAFEEAINVIVIYRQTIRDMLWQAGIPNNPGSLDSELFEGLSSKLGVKNRYEEIFDDFKVKREARANSSK